MNLVCASGGQKLELSEKAFAREFNEDLVHQVLVAYMAQARQGSRAQKNRAPLVISYKYIVFFLHFQFPERTENFQNN